MGFAIPQVLCATESRASGAQVIEGSLKFDEDNKNYLKITPSSNGNRRTWTWSGWVKRNTFGSSLMSRFFMGGTTSTSAGNAVLAFYQDQLFWQIGSSSERITTNRVFRDTGWYHIVVAVDTTIASPESERVKLYVNGIQETSFGTTGYPAQNVDSGVNSTQGMLVGAGRDSGGNEPDGPFDGQISNTYLIDGLQLGPGYFGYTDPLTNTWRPKKFEAKGTTVNDGRTFSSIGTFTNWDDDGNYPKTELFDGTVYTGGTPNGASPNDGNQASFDFGDQRITGFQNLQINIFISSNQVGATNLASVNGVDITREIHNAGNNTWTTVDLGNKFTTLQSFTIKNNNCYVGGFIIDGVVVKNATVQNLDFGTNGFYLPLDGKSFVGQDESGKGNHFTPQGFGGSVELDNPIASGAKPILNTTQGGTQAGLDVFGENVGQTYTVTASGGKYYLDGTVNPMISMIRGATYVFDYSAASGHPFRFATAADAAGGTQYSNGVVVSGNVTSITVPFNAPDTLYYYCTFHSGMGNSISVTTDETKTDIYASDCVLALPYCGKETDATPRLTTNSSIMTSWSSNSASFEKPGHFYNSSLYMSGSSDYPRINFSAGALNFMHNSTGTGTIEFWGRPASVNTGATWASTSGGSDEIGFGIYSNNNGQEVACFISNGSSGQSTGTTSSLAPTPHDKWVHIAVVKTPTQLRLYTDGVLRATQNISSYSFNNNNSTRNFIQHGSSIQQSGSRGWNGAYMSDFRVYEGIEKYTGTTVNTQYFVPPSTDPDVLPETPSGVTGNSKLTKIIDGAVHFDGSGDYLIAGDNTDLAVGSGDFTLECFVYRDKSVSAFTNFIATRGAPGSANGFTWGAQASDNGYDVEFYTNAMSGINGGNQLITPDKWHHCVLTRSGSTLRSFVNGVLNTTTSNSQDFSNTSMTIGMTNDGSQGPMKGYISNVRVIKGSIPTEYQTTSTTVDTKIFDPPTTPLTNVTNTKLLCCQSNNTPAAAEVSPRISGVNDGTTWSSYLSLTDGGTWNQTYPPAQIFDGTTSAEGSGSGNIFFRPPGGISYTNSVRVYNMTGGVNVAYYLNGSNVLENSGSGWKTLVTGSSGTLNTLEVDRTGNDLGTSISAIEIDGVILVDPVGVLGNSSAANFNPFITDINTVRGQETRYATLNPLDTNLGNNLKDGNTRAVGSSNWSAGHARGSIALTSGKWFWESTYSAGSSTLQFGFANSTASLSETYGTVPANSWTYYFPNSSIVYPSGGVSSYFPSGASLGDTIGCALDMDNGTWQFFKNGVGGVVYKLNATDSTSTASITELYPWVGSYNGTQDINFGQKPFKFPPPDGFQPLNIANFTRSETVITRPDKYVGVKLYVGNGGTQSINSLMDPDFVWIKNRDETISHFLFDSVRGANKYLRTDTLNAEDTGSSNQLSFIHKGFTVNGAGGGVNKNTIDFVSWSWKAGGNKNTFNVDDVGYASASNVNMSVGALNSEVYNTSNRWSDDYGGASLSSGYEITKAFDGNRTTTARVEATQTAMSVALTGITVTDKIEVRGELGYITPYVEVTVGGTRHRIGGNPDDLITGSAGTASRIITGVSGALTNVKIGRVSSGRTYLSQIIVDGKILVDDNITPQNAPSIANTGCSVGTKQGFSIIKYAGSGSNGSIAHGLSQAPDFIFGRDLEDTSSSRDWIIYHKDIGANGRLKFTTDGTSTSSTFFQDTPPSDKVINVGTSNDINSTNDYVLYCWHDVPGLQKAGKYSGVSSSNGPYIELGFRPALVMFKRTTSHSNGGWYIYDSSRDSHNTAYQFIVGESAYAERRASNNSSFVSTYYIDFLSSGFKLRHNSTNLNDGSTEYIYMAWAEAPSINLYGAQSNAR